MSPRLFADGREYEIGEDVWNAWKDQAQPFESPDDVLRRALGIETATIAGGVDAAGSAGTDEPGWGSGVRRSRRPEPGQGRDPSRRVGRAGSKRASRSRVSSSMILPEREYELPVLRALAETGGRRPTREVIEAVGESLKDRLTEADKEPLAKGGGLRWENRVQFVRLRLVREGLLKKDSPRGVWELEDAGRERLESDAA